jgi:NCS1 family nucleobase:cation symporter-1
VPGAFFIAASAAFGQSGGWSTCGADHARYLRPLLAVFLGSLSANSLNLYSSSLSLSLSATGVRLPTAFGRAVLALLLGAAALGIGMLVLDRVDGFTNYLLVVSYGTAPWIGVVLADRLLCRRPDALALCTDRRHVNRAGPVAMLTALVVSVGLFGNQALYVGPVPRAVPQIGDVTLLVGFVLGFVLYAVLRPGGRPTRP